MKCAILEDDISVHEQVQEYIEKHGKLKLIGAYTNIPDATAALELEQADLLFLDIELSAGRTGLEFYNIMEVKPCVIVMTAHPKYAIDSHKIHANGFLHKPFDFDSFKETVDHAINVASKLKKLDALHQIEHNTGNYILILDNRKEVILPYSEIAYFAIKGGILVAYTINDIEYGLKGMRSINQLEKELPYQLFQRINKGQIINKSNIQKTFGDVVLVNNKMLKISSRCMAEINKNIEQEK